jgi:stalled ribosome rescue protein Dom34
MPHKHAVVWIDSRQAHVFKFVREDVEKKRIKAELPFRKIHHKAGSIGAGHVRDDEHYFHSIVEAMAEAEEWLVVGPGEAKKDLVKHIEKHDPRLKAKLVGVEAADHPTDGELLKHARAVFNAVDKLRGTKPLPS